MPDQPLSRFKLDSPWGAVHAALGPRGLVALALPRGGQKALAAVLARRAPGARAQPVDPESTAAGRQLAGYLAGRSKRLGAPVDLEGLPDFTRRVLEVVRAIPYGQTRSYAEVAAAAGNPRAARAVGQVMNKNPVPLFIPCHRVVGANGSLVGFGSGLALKRALLAMEAGGRGPR